MDSRGVAGERVTDALVASNRIGEGSRGYGEFEIEIIRDGETIERFRSKNLIVDQGLTYKTAVALLGVTGIGAWHVIPIDGSPTIAAGDTYGTQLGWSEVTAYDETTRQVWAGVAGNPGAATNAASRVELTISTGGATIGGVALVGGGTDPTVKGDTAGGGTLFSASAFTGGDRVLQATDLLRITWAYAYTNTA